MQSNDTTANPPQHVGSTAELGGLPEPVGFRSRYRSEPGMIGHYPWTYADHRRRKYDRPECEYEDLFTAEQLRAAVAAERERWQQVAKAVIESHDAALAYVCDRLRSQGVGNSITISDSTAAEIRAVNALRELVQHNTEGQRP